MRFVDQKRQLLLLGMAAAGTVAVILLVSAGRVLIALALVFYIPGYSILQLFGRDPTATTGQILYACALSLGVVIIGGFFLHLSGSMTPVQWAILLIAVSAIAFRYRAPRDAQKPVELPHSQNAWHVSASEALMIAGAVILAISALAIDRREAAAHSEFKYSEFWMVPQNPGKPNVLTIGVKNEEGQPASYDVEYMTGGQFAGHLPSFRLAPGEVWASELNAAIRPDQVQRVEAWLFKNGDHHTVYRRVWADIGRARPEGL
jgi:hypothetical protein